MSGYVGANADGPGLITFSGLIFGSVALPLAGGEAEGPLEQPNITPRTKPKNNLRMSISCEERPEKKPPFSSGHDNGYQSAPKILPSAGKMAFCQVG